MTKTPDWMNGEADDEFGELYDKQGLCDLLGLTRFALDSYLELKPDGVVQRGNKRLPWKIEAGAFLRWLTAHKMAGTATLDPKTRRMIADMVWIQRSAEAA